MRIVDPVQLDRERSLESVMTANMPRHVLASLAETMRDVDQYETPGPAKMAVLELDAGSTVVVVYHETKDLIEILAPLDHTLEDALAEIINVLRIPRTSIEWLREGIALPGVYEEHSKKPLIPSAAIQRSSSIDLPTPPVQSRFWRIEAESAIAQRPLGVSESISLTLLMIRLMHSAGDFQPIGETDLRVIQMTDTILFEDGSEAAPLAVYFTIPDDGATARIVDVKQLPPNKVHMATGTLTSAIETARIAELDTRWSTSGFDKL